MIEGEPTKTYAYTYTNAWKDQLTDFDGQSIVYDTCGNPTSYLGATLTWSRGRLLTRFTKDSTTSRMTYDANGIRMSKLRVNHIDIVDSSYIYDSNGRLRTETEGAYTRRYLYSSDGIVGYEENGERYFYRKNLFGDITAIYQGATKLAEYVYDAWGNCTVTYDTNGVGARNPMRYRGYYWDKDLKMYYLMTRYYDPTTGRFINADTPDYLDPETLGGLNLYAYCKNNPVMCVDPSGHFPGLILAAAILLFTPVGGTVAQVATSVVSYAGVAVASIFDEDIRNDMNAIGWNPFNTDESATLSSSKVSFYKGVPIFRIAAGGRSGSFGAIFLTKGSSIDTLRHERGHNSQLMRMGVVTYLFAIGTPSALMLGPWSKDPTNPDLYYCAPWEITADLFGGVSRPVHTNADISLGWQYFDIITGQSLIDYLFP